jgi:hypothetical protein
MKRKLTPLKRIERAYSMAMDDLRGYERRHGPCPGQRAVIKLRYDLALAQLVKEALSK